jgi:hypothetical protein
MFLTELLCFQTKPSFFVPFLILGVLTMVSSSVSVIVLGIYALLYDLEVGISALLIGGLTVGKYFESNGR